MLFRVWGGRSQPVFFNLGWSIPPRSGIEHRERLRSYSASDAPKARDGGGHEFGRGHLSRQCQNQSAFFIPKTTGSVTVQLWSIEKLVWSAPSASGAGDVDVLALLGLTPQGIERCAVRVAGAPCLF